MCSLKRVRFGYRNSKSQVPDSETLVTEGDTQHKRIADKGNKEWTFSYPCAVQHYGVPTAIIWKTLAVKSS